MKNSNVSNLNSTKSQYQYHLWNFNKWLSGKTFTINTIDAKSNAFIKKIKKIQFKNVECLFDLLEQPFTDQKNVTRIIKQYLLDDVHAEKKASYLVVIKSAITSYFEKNEQPIQILFKPKSIYSIDAEYKQSMSISELMSFLTTGKPSVTEKVLFLCKFHRGLDVSTLVDRFNYEAWDQIVKWFGSENHDSRDLEKCPVPITLTRLKTDFSHVGFLERDAISELQKYLEFRKTKTNCNMQSNQPLFLNKFGKPVSSLWVFVSFSRIAKRAGIQKFVEFNGRKQYNMDSHELRDLLKSTLIDSGCRIDVADHVIGHKPKDSYEKQSTLYPETLRKEYAKASKRLNLFTKFSNIVSGNDDSDELRIELNAKIQEISQIKDSLLDKAIITKREEIFADVQQKRMEDMQRQIDELSKQVTTPKEKPSMEFCCTNCSTVHNLQECPVCGSKIKRIYEETKNQ